jgi:hypothetical protein
MLNSDYAADIRRMIQHENELVNNRITWMATSNGLLFTALGFSWGKSTVLAYALAVLGIAVCASAFASLSIAAEAVKHLNQLWLEKLIVEADVPPVIGQETSSRWLRLLLPWNSLPVMFAVGWVGICVITASGHAYIEKLTH